MSKDAPVAEGRTHQFTTRSGADTIEVGRKLAGILKPPQLLLLRGELGTGKTTLVKGIAQALDGEVGRRLADDVDIGQDKRLRRGAWHRGEAAQQSARAA